MPNMSYCMWENTSLAIDQCVTDFEESHDTVDDYFMELSEDERRGFIRACYMMRQLLEEVEDSDICKETR